MNLYRVLAFISYLLNEIEKLNSEIEIQVNYHDNDKKLRILYIMRTNRIKMLARNNERIDRQFYRLNTMQICMLNDIQNNDTYKELYYNGLI